MSEQKVLNTKFPDINRPGMIGTGPSAGPKVNLIAPVSRKYQKFSAEEVQKISNAVVQQINGMAG